MHCMNCPPSHYIIGERSEALLMKSTGDFSISHSTVVLCIQVNKKFRKFGRKYRDCIKRNGDKIGTQTSYDIST